MSKLKDLGLDGNKISDISVLEKVNLPQLEELGLFGNIISSKGAKIPKLFISAKPVTPFRRTPSLRRRPVPPVHEFH